MAESVGGDFDSVTSSQILHLKNSSFADPESCLPTDGEVVETDSDGTEILANSVSPQAIPTPTTLESINVDEVFHTPPENASLSSAADSEPGFRVSEMTKSKPKPKSKSPRTTPESVSTNRLDSDSGEDIPFRMIMEALLRNTNRGENENVDEQVSFVNILKQSGLKFP